MGRGCPINVSSKQKINKRSSTEAKLMAVNKVMPPILWVRMFLIEQGYEVTKNIMYQGNMSAMLLEKNRRHSSGKNTRHIERRYYFITNDIKRGNTKVEYCPTKEMVSDGHTKPTQGSLFGKHRETYMNI